MSHIDQINFINIFRDYYKTNFNFDDCDILEIGSYDVNGSTRQSFSFAKSFLGIDLVKGPGVDIVMNGDQIDKLNKKFDIVLSCECFEHAVNWKKIFLKMIDVSKKDSFVVISVASTGRIEHGTTRSGNWQSPGTKDEYYKNLTKKEFLLNFKIDEIFSNYFFYYNVNSFDLYFVGMKGFNHKTENFKELISKFKFNYKKKKLRKVIFYIFSKILNEKFRQDFFFLRVRIKNKIKKFLGFNI